MPSKMVANVILNVLEPRNEIKSKLAKPMVRFFFKTAIRFYQVFVSPFLGCNCRFVPSCSCYALEALSVHGVFRGAFFATKRLLRCHPFACGGYDPVPNTVRNIPTE